MQANSRGAAQYIPTWVMCVQIIWKVLFPKELLQTAFLAGITDQIKAPGCVLNPLLGCVFISCWHDRCGMDLSHLHPREEQSQLAEDHCTLWAGHPPTVPASHPKMHQYWGVWTGWRVPALLGARRLSWAPALRRVPHFSREEQTSSR